MSNTTLIELNGLIRSGEERKKILLRTNLILFGALFMIIFFVPVIPIKDRYLTSMLLSIVVASGLFAADFSRAAFRILLTIGTVVIMVTLIDLFLPDLKYLNIITFGLNTLVFIVVTIALVAHVFMAREVFGSTLLCAINSYLLIGLTLSMLFLIMDIYFPSSFNQVESGEGNFSTFVYYGFITLTTLGYGDITPDTSLARSLSTFTALFGQLYLVIIMALIIGKYLNVNEPGK